MAADQTAHPGHCRHCVKSPSDHAGQCRDGYGARWVFRCPACAEAERIAEAIYGKIEAAGDSLPVGSGKFRAGYISGLDDAAGIASGEECLMAPRKGNIAPPGSRKRTMSKVEAQEYGEVVELHALSRVETYEVLSIGRIIDPLFKRLCDAVAWAREQYLKESS